MAARKKKEKGAELVRKTLQVEAAKLEALRKALGLANDSEVVRFAVDHLLGHLVHHEEE